MKETISKIREIDFTAREIDVISCILNIKGSKKISQFLSISNRTVEGYILNIMRKMRTNSQEGKKDFVESSEELPVLISHYNNLAIKAFFIKKLRDISYSSTKPKYSIIFDDKDNSDTLGAIREYLSDAKITINREKSSSGEFYQLVAISKEYVRRIINGEKFPNVIFICLDSEIGEMELKNFQHITFIDCSEQVRIYNTVFRIMEILNTDASISKHVAEFERYRNNIITQNKIRFSNTREGFHREAINGINSISRVLNKNFVILSIIFVIAFTSIIWINIGNSGRKIFMEHKSVVSSNFAIPNSTILLHRTSLIKKISSQLDISKEINIVALVGRGGAGKTILARDYARLQTAKIIWEINAETPGSIISSFEQLAFALCIDIKEKQDLTKLLKQHKPEQREKQLLLFVQDRLKENNNWLLIYDNVESFGKIKEYFPYNYNAWGKGKIIITTRDINIKNNTYIDDQNIIQVDSLSEEEKHQLFSNIMGDYLKNHDKISTAKFIEQIPPYPLDI
jgi:DNA-binding CsgD family transcriptional regulator